MCFECFGILYGLVHSHHLYCLRCPGALETSTISRPWVVSASASFSMVFKFSKPRVFKGFLPIATSAFPPFNGVSKFSKLRAFVTVGEFSLFIRFRDLRHSHLGNSFMA